MTFDEYKLRVLFEITVNPILYANIEWCAIDEDLKVYLYASKPKITIVDGVNMFVGRFPSSTPAQKIIHNIGDIDFSWKDSVICLKELFDD